MWRGKKNSTMKIIKNASLANFQRASTYERCPNYFPLDARLAFIMSGCMFVFMALWWLMCIYIYAMLFCCWMGREWNLYFSRACGVEAPRWPRHGRDAFLVRRQVSSGEIEIFGSGSTITAREIYCRNWSSFKFGEIGMHNQSSSKAALINSSSRMKTFKGSFLSFKWNV